MQNHTAAVLLHHFTQMSMVALRDCMAANYFLNLSSTYCHTKSSNGSAVTLHEYVGQL